MAVTIEDYRRAEADLIVTARLQRHLEQENPSKKAKSEDVDLQEKGGSETASYHSDDSAEDSNKSFTYNEIIRCQICGDKASGMHYGVYSCEGCKGFYRRTQRMKLKYKPCPYWESKPCDINIKSRNKCQYCRFQKCVSLGMSTGAVRMGRVPRAEKEKLIHDLELIKDNSLLSETDEERHHRQFVDRIYESYAGIFECEKSTEEVEGFRKYVHQDMDVTFPTGVVFTVKPLGISEEQLNGKPRELTNPFHISRHISCASEIGIHKTAIFLKKISDFRALGANDQLILFKESCFEIALMSNAERYYQGVLHFPEDNTFVHEHRMEVILSRMDIQRPKIKYFVKLNTLKLNGREKALFTMLILAAPDREDLENKTAVELFQNQLVTAFAKELAKNHPNKKNLLANTINLLTLLRDVMPEQISKLNAIIKMFDGKLPVQPSPLMKEVYRLT
ncbi:peroxisome proliferator-activated receptor delta-like [Asterias rubens]|uniref:peroxisome proliferator-activated receptor delta-like n=1 Tax=Asterias rubens TaxID=7604 RepID=UPI0014555443|nr:peroxisome proliferator-activated receptor delta-like [Asterias rubens]